MPPTHNDGRNYPEWKRRARKSVKVVFLFVAQAMFEGERRRSERGWQRFWHPELAMGL